MDPELAQCLGLVAAAFGIAAFSWPARRLNGWTRAAWLLPASGACVLLAAFTPETSIWLKGFTAIACPVIGIKLIDLHVGYADWRRRRMSEWLWFLAVHVVLVYRVYARQPVRPLGQTLALVLRGCLKILAGAARLNWAFSREFGSFWVEHTVKLAGLYLCVLDGAFVLITGVCRAIGWPVADQTRHPIAAATPADFWRRYNMEAGRFFHEDVFKPLGGRRWPVTAILSAFLINGVLHEYMAWLMSGVVTGYQVLLFVIFGVAVAATWRVRPRGAARVVWNAATIVFLLVVSVLFFTSAETFVDWYSQPSPLPLR